MFFADIAYASNAFEGNRAKTYLIEQGFGSANTYTILATAYNNDREKLSLPELNVTEVHWTAAWA